MSLQTHFSKAVLRMQNRFAKKFIADESEVTAMQFSPNYSKLWLGFRNGKVGRQPPAGR